ncbi:YHS domain-containing (seleno)protein [Parendozoicomonas haliclonae]|uniref:YHS domain-containing protein n=1 Tax=Parendozoicomonas haliclonae TaxID=1960125 RepID=A0A1X7AJH4_9GAMM|nr:YHS domain-containing (seleno)protein [Parendozoicomonas haliclonae]SMA45932.1 hypothetical protein EHSB41UT_02040 [Parendozoicomonas haliclonae]
MQASRKLLIFLLWFLPCGVNASEYHTTFWGNLAVGGYDPVAYFTEEDAMKGSEDFEYDWQGAKWRFISQKHLDLFKANPEKYAPRYGGHCAWAVASKNRLYRGSPQHWDIVQGELYLNHSDSVNRRWRANSQQHIGEADENWEQLKAE